MANQQQTIIDAINTRIETITTDNGYVTNIGENVLVDEAADISDEESPYTRVVDFEDECGINTSVDGIFLYELPIAIEAYITGTTSPKTGREAVFDILEAVGQDPRCSNSIAYIKPVSQSIEVEHAGKKAVKATVWCNIKYQTKAYARTQGEN